MDLNGNGITVSNAIWEQMKPNIPKMADGRPQHPIKADALKPVVEKYNSEGKPFNIGHGIPVSTHNYELRYWLAAGGINPVSMHLIKATRPVRSMLRPCCL